MLIKPSKAESIRNKYQSTRIKSQASGGGWGVQRIKNLNEITLEDNTAMLSKC